MTIRDIIQEDIVNDINTYKSIYYNYIDFIKEAIDKNYEPSFGFDDFCIRMINNFDNVDEEFFRFLNETGKPLTERMMKSLIGIALDEFKEDEISLKKLKKIKYL